MISNLKPGGLAHKLTKEEMARGGKKSTLKKKFAKIKKCSPKCPIYPCFIYSLSKERFKGKCALKEFPKEIQERALKLFLEGAKGLDKEILGMVIILSSKIDLEKPDEIKEYIELLLKVRKVIFSNINSPIEEEVKEMETKESLLEWVLKTCEDYVKVREEYKKWKKEKKNINSNPYELTNNQNNNY